MSEEVHISPFGDQGRGAPVLESPPEEREPVHPVQEDLGIDGEPVQEYLVLCEHNMLTLVRAQDSQWAVNLFVNKSQDCMPVRVWSQSPLRYTGIVWDTVKNISLQFTVDD